MATTSDSDALTIKDAIGAVDGVNTSFATPDPYQPGSLAVIIGGIFGSVVETGPTTFETPSPPFLGDRVRVQYAKA